MKNILTITASVATLVAAGGLASAQGLNEHREPCRRGGTRAEGTDE
jgi:hypothetical protein